jgi:hypothetical protein
VKLPLLSPPVRRWISDHQSTLKRLGLALSLVIFGGGIYLSIQSLPELPSRIEVGPFLVLVLAGVPITIALNTYEFWIMTRVAGSPTPWRSCLEVTVFASAANMFSLPGGIITRAAALRAYGTPIALGSKVIFAFAGAWIGVSFLYAGLWLVAQNQLLIGGMLLLLGSCAVAVCGWVLFTLQTSRVLTAQLIAMRIAAALVEATRNLLAVYAIGETIGFAEASVYSASSVAGAASTIIPAGLGIAEGLAALISPLVEVNPAIGFLAVGINRVLFMAILSMLAGLLLFQTRKPGL